MEWFRFMMFTVMSNDCPYVHDKLIKLLLSKTECETVPWKNILYIFFCHASSSHWSVIVLVNSLTITRGRVETVLIGKNYQSVRRKHCTVTWLIPKGLEPGAIIFSIILFLRTSTVHLCIFRGRHCWLIMSLRGWPLSRRVINLNQ